jgi:hypothetical protein
MLIELGGSEKTLARADGEVDDELGQHAVFDSVTLGPASNRS